MNQSRINGARKETYHKEEKAGLFTIDDGLKYIGDNELQSMKYEDPGKDDFVLNILKTYPKAKFVCSYRPLEMVIKSHFNIKKWGHHEGDVIYHFSASLALYKEIFEAGQLVMVDLTKPHLFDQEKFADALEANITPEFTKVVEGWNPVNDLKYQVEKTEEYNDDMVQAPPRIERLSKIHPWIPSSEAQYLQLCQETSQL